MKKSLIVALSLVLLKVSAFAYDGLLFKPLTANVFEPRVGATYNFDDNKLRLDIGTSIDLTDFKFKDSSEIRIGGDFFTYTRLRSQSNFKFPVETSDYFFGVNSTIKTKLFDKEVFGRVRIAHISSHLVDGMSDEGKFERMPFIYSREFIDLTLAANFNCIRVYGGFTFVFSTRPANVTKINPEFGFDFEPAINPWLNVYGGYDFKLSGDRGVATGINAAQIGLKFKTSEKTGLSLSYYFYSGKSMHGMYYFEKDFYNGLGFQLLF